MPFGIMAVSGLVNAIISATNSRNSLAANAEQQEINRQFQEAQQQKQWQHAEKLQKEMREMTRRNFLEQLAEQEKNAQFQSLQAIWPLPSSSPRLLIKEFNDYLERGVPIPLQLIVVENGDMSKGPLAIKQEVRNAINELNKFMSLHYGQNSLYGVKVHDTDKCGANFGASEVDLVFQVFKVAPTMILTSRVHDSCYILECWYWGCGSATKPVMTELFKCDMAELQMSVLKDMASEWCATKARLGVEDEARDSLVDLMGRVDSYCDNLKQRGATPEEVRLYGYSPFKEEIAQFTSRASKKIDAAPFMARINEGIKQCILSSFKVCSSLLSDAHFLLEYQATPRFFQICNNELRQVPQLMNQAEEFFASALKALPGDSNSGTALMNVRMAAAYQQANNPQKALQYSRKCTDTLEKMVKPEHFAIEASDDMLICVDELKQINGAAQAAPWIVSQTNKDLTPDELNVHAASLYKSGQIEKAISVWNKAVEQKHQKSMRNLSKVLESLGRQDEANLVYAKAIMSGDTSLYEKGHEVAMWYCRQGAWARAFAMWCAYLESGDSAYRCKAVAYSAFLLFTTSIVEILDSDYNRWVAALQLDGAGRKPQSVAEELLLETVSSESYAPEQVQPFYDVLATWYMKSNVCDIPLFYGIHANAELAYKLPSQLPSEYETLFRTCLLRAGRPDIINH